MKKLLICLLIMVLLLTPQAAMAQESATATSAEYQLLTEFVTDNPSRVAGTTGEDYASNWLANKMIDFGYDALLITKQTFSVAEYGVASVDGFVGTSANIIVDKPSADASGTVIIGAHYDCAQIGQGVSDNGGGVATVLSLAQKLKDVSLDYNLRFIFFGAEEYGLVGSRYYVSTLSDSQKQDILLMINIDVVANGDYLYVWGEDGYTPQADYFIKVAGGKVRALPAYEKAIYGMSVTGSRPYYVVAHAADSMSFVDAGVPVAFFFSGNMTSGNFGYVENAGKDGVMHTGNDTLQYIQNNYYQQTVSNMSAVVNTVYDGITARDFVGAVADADKYIISDFWLSSTYAMIIFLVLLAAAVVFCYRYHTKLKKRAILGTADVKQDRIFDRPDDEDVFTFRS